MGIFCQDVDMKKQRCQLKPKTLWFIDLPAVFPLWKFYNERNVCFIAHAIAQPCRRTNSEVLKELCDIYTMLNLEC